MATSLGIAFWFGHPLCSCNVKGKALSKSLWRSIELLRANYQSEVVDPYCSQRKTHKLLIQSLKRFHVYTLRVSCLSVFGDMLSQLAEYYWGTKLTGMLMYAKSHMWWKLASKIGWVQGPSAVFVETETQPWELPAGEVSLLSEEHVCPAENLSALSKRMHWERSGAYWQDVVFLQHAAACACEW